ncbi:MAG: TIGR02147 family protein [Bdellovibrionota bacterium]
MIESIDIFACQDLPAFFSQLKQLKRFKSIRHLSAQLGYASDTPLGQTLSGRRALSPGMLSRLAKWLGLTPQEIYFVSLLSEKQKAIPKTIAGLDAQLADARPSKLNPVPLDPALMQQLALWHHHAVGDVVGALGKEASFARILRAFQNRLNEAELRKCLALEVEYGRLKLDGEIYSRTNTGTYWLGGQVPSAYVQESHRQFLELAKQAITTQSLAQRHLISMSFPLKKEKVAYAKKRVAELMRDLLAELHASEDQGESLIYQANLQLFELADPN